MEDNKYASANTLRRTKAGYRECISFVDYESWNKTLAINTIKYGLNIKRYGSSGKYHYRRFYLLESSREIIQWISPHKPFEHSRLRIYQIWKIEKGQKSTNFRKKPCLKYEDLSCSIYCGSSRNSTLDLIFDSEEQMMLFLSGIHYLMEDARAAEENDQLKEMRAFQSAWNVGDKDGSGGLDFQEVKTMFCSLNIEANEEYLKELFDQVDTDNNKVIDKEEFNTLMEILMFKEEIQALFNNYSQKRGSQSVIPVENFKRFLEEEQEMGEVSLEETSELIQRFSMSPNDSVVIDQHLYISEKGFRQYIFSVEVNSLFKDEKFEKCLDMTQPLTDYFIESSHNTYLEGHQITGKSNVNMYTRVLQSGCRCVELDIWDGPNGNPKITHGHTFVTNIDFRNVVEAIKETAFVSSEYPVILSLENHCSFEQQGKMAEVFEEVMGELIYVPSPELTKYPSPEELKYKILVKGKVPPDGKTDIKVGEEKVKLKVNPALQKLFALEGEKLQLTERPFKRIPSINYPKLLKLAEKHSAKILVEYHKKNFSRIYPPASSIDSKNYNPMPAWLLGSQIVALNYQQGDLGMLLNKGLFNQNGGTGYVLKPQIMREESTSFDPKGSEMESVLFVLEVELISANQLPKLNEEDSGVVNPFVKIGLHGIQQDTKKEQSKVIENNGFNPVWNQKFEFGIRMAEIALLSFRVYNKTFLGKSKIAQYAIPIECIRNGYRVVPLYGKDLDFKRNASLLCRFKMKPYFSD